MHHYPHDYLLYYRSQIIHRSGNTSPYEQHCKKHMNITLGKAQTNTSPIRISFPITLGKAQTNTSPIRISFPLRTEISFNTQILPLWHQTPKTILKQEHMMMSRDSRVLRRKNDYQNSPLIIEHMPYHHLGKIHICKKINTSFCTFTMM
jgi:hypothetical protein